MKAHISNSNKLYEDAPSDLIITRPEPFSRSHQRWDIGEIAGLPPSEGFMGKRLCVTDQGLSRPHKDQDKGNPCYLTISPDLLQYF
jgi:hypothetical protein